MQSNSHEQYNIRNMHTINQYAVKKMAYDGKNTRNIVALKQIQSLKYSNIDATLEQQVDKTIDKKKQPS